MALSSFAREMREQLLEAEYGLQITARYLSKAVADNELQGTVIPVTHALETIEGKLVIIRALIVRVDDDAREAEKG